MMDVQNHESLGKQINTPTYNIIAHLLEWLKFKTWKTPHVGEGVEELELSYSPVDRLKWYHHCEKQFFSLF